jgi:TolB-like protein/Flp pilus assembly protein TadD
MSPKEAMAKRPFSAYEGTEPYFFVSYAHDEADAVYPEMSWITEAGFNIWYDDGIHVGSVWRQALADALSGSVAMIFFATSSSIESSNCLKELNFILDEDKPVFVIQLDDGELPSLLRLALSDRQALIRSEFDESTYRERMVTALSTIVAPVPRSSAAQAAQPTSSLIRTDPPSITVLPATYLGKDEELSYICDGITGDLIARLSHRGWHIVAGHREDTTLSSQQIGERRGVRYILGSILQRGGDRMRLTAHLTDVANGQELWGQRYERMAMDTLELQDRLVNSIDHDLFEAVMVVESRRLQDVADEELDAWGLCARARIHVVDRSSRDRALSLVKQAVTLDPNFAYAHSLYGRLLAEVIFKQFTRQIDQYGKLALQHTERALSLAPNNVVILNGAALVHRIVGDPETALQLAERGAQIIGQPTAALLSALIIVGRFEQALEIGNAESELQVSPDMIAGNLVADRLDQAYEWARRATTLQPDNFLSWVHLACVQARLEQEEDARASLARAREIVPTFTLDLFQAGSKIAWRRDDIVEAFEVGLRQLNLS